MTQKPTAASTDMSSRDGVAYERQAQLQVLDEQVRRLRDASVADSTWNAYLSAWNRWARWASDHELPVLPARAR